MAILTLWFRGWYVKHHPLNRLLAGEQCISNQDAFPFDEIPIRKQDRGLPMERSPRSL